MIPDNVEKIIMTKEDYDRNVEQMLHDKVNAELEVKRLNNIINELEKYLQENIHNIYAYFDNTPFGVEETYKEVLSKLHELKGDESNGR